VPSVPPRVFRALAMSACGVSLVLSTTAAAAVAGSPEPSGSATPAESSWPAPSSPEPDKAAADETLREDAAYWTAERMRSATPVPAAGRNPKTGTGKPRRAAARLAPPPPGTPKGTLFEGVPTVGTFFVDQPAGNTTCSGSVVKSPGHNVVLTAGHCVENWTGGKHWIFVPKYNSNKAAGKQPFGFFPIKKIVLDPRYKSRPSSAQVTNLDFAFTVVGPNAAGKKLEDVTGALTLRVTPSYVNTVTVIGYPKNAGFNPKRKAIKCTMRTKRLPGYRQMQMLCGGYYGGVSGSPWIANFDPAKGTGRVIGNVGGRNDGGNNEEDDWVSYSPFYDHEIMDLYADTVAGRTPRRPPYAPGVR